MGILFFFTGGEQLVFTFQKENPDKFVAIKAVPQIAANHRCDPLVWTPQFQQVTTRRVYVLCTQTGKGRNTFRVYPLQKRDAPHPAFVIVPVNSPWVTHPATHVVYQHSDFTIIRPLIAVYYKAKTAIKRGELQYIPGSLLTLVRHCYFKEMIDDAFIDNIQKQFEKLEKLVALTSSNWENEAHVSNQKALQLCGKILEKINKGVKIE